MNRRSYFYLSPRNFSNEFLIYLAPNEESKKAVQELIDQQDPIKSSWDWLTKKELKSLISWARRERAWFDVLMYEPDELNHWVSVDELEV